MSVLIWQVLAEALETEAALEGSWVFLGSDGTAKGPFTRTELLNMYTRYCSMPLSSLTHDTELMQAVAILATVEATGLTLNR